MGKSSILTFGKSRYSLNTDFARDSDMISFFSYFFHDSCVVSGDTKGDDNKAAAGKGRSKFVLGASRLSKMPGA